MAPSSRPGERDDIDAVVVGAGPAGLAVGACLTTVGVPHVLLERHDRIGATWHRHYDRLHLHTDKARSALPGLPFPRGYPRYPSRAQVTEYLDAYAKHFGLAPRFGQAVVEIRPVGERWLTRTGDTEYPSRSVVVATGYNAQPVVPRWPGQETFGGRVLHSSDYRNGAPYAGQRVLVVGLGNSGGEIAIDLVEHGAAPTLSVRGPVTILPRDLLGIPLLALAIPLARLPAGLADALTAPLLWALFGDLSRRGLRTAPRGPIAGIRARARIPLIDVGTASLIRSGRVQVRRGVRQFGERAVTFEDGTVERFDAVILATGYRPTVHELLGGSPDVLDGEGRPRDSGAMTVLRGLYFCGFHVSPTGMLREIARDARRIAAAIAGERPGHSRTG